MIDTQLVDTECPYCGEPIQLIVDPSMSEQEYIEDCQVCCRPIRVQAMVEADGTASVIVLGEDD